MKFLIPFITLSFLLLFNTSCEEFNDIVLDNTKVLESIEEDFDIVRSYEYDEKERVSRLNLHSAFSGTITHYYEYDYGKDTVSIAFINNSNEITLRVEKLYDTDRQTVRRDFYDINNDLTAYYIYRYNGNPCGYSEFEAHSPDGTITSRSTYAYYNVNCSQDIHYYNNNDDLIARARIERDDKQAYFESTSLDILRRSKGGNITSFTYMNADSVVNDDISYFIDYQYNDFDDGDYPIVENKYYNNGGFEDRKFNYIGVQ